MASLAEAREELAAKQDHIARIFAEAGPELDLSRVTMIDGDSHAKGAEIRRLQKEAADIGEEVERLEALDNIRRLNEQGLKSSSEPDGKMVFGGAGASGAPRGVSHRGVRDSLKSIFLAQKGYQQFRAGQADRFQMDLPFTDLKALITLTTVSPQNIRRPDLVQMALEERTVSDLMMEGQVDRGVIEYYEETTFTNNATMTAEGAAKTESDFAVTLRSDTVRKVAHWFQATTESLADVSWLESQLRGRLAFGVRRKEEQQLLSGDGTGQNILGLLNRSGIQTEAKGANTTMDAVYRAMQKVRGASGNGFAEPTGLVFHPNDWTEIKLTKSTDGIYLYGTPSEEAGDRLWGLPVRQTTGITEGTGLVGAFRPYAEILRREGITIKMSDEHASFAIENKVLLIAESRLGLAVTRPSAFCTVTGI